MARGVIILLRSQYSGKVNHLKIDDIKSTMCMKMSITPVPTERSVLLTSVSWETYERLLAEQPDAHANKVADGSTHMQEQSDGIETHKVPPCSFFIRQDNAS